ncbi:histidine phosphatase family protein [Desulfobacterota bacterium AH_259_B03_O07]|nr:histidine phosphatase family protein [Desulfobacterota bacterium AH_259_B03_O07]
MKNDDKIPKVFLARHCKTQWNLENRLVGTSDIPLCQEGREEANDNLTLIENLGIQRIICSPLKRAYETAKTYADHLGVPLHVHQGLKEIDHGSWNGREIEELLNDANFKRWFEEDPTSVPIPDGTETIQSAQKRIVKTIKDIALSYPNETILVIMHKHIRSLLRCAVYDYDFRQWRENIDNRIEPIEIPRTHIIKLCELAA